MTIFVHIWSAFIPSNSTRATHPQALRWIICKQSFDAHSLQNHNCLANTLVNHTHTFTLSRVMVAKSLKTIIVGIRARCWTKRRRRRNPVAIYRVLVHNFNMSITNVLSTSQQCVFSGSECVTQTNMHCVFENIPCGSPLRGIPVQYWKCLFIILVKRNDDVRDVRGKVIVVFELIQCVCLKWEYLLK